MRVHLILDVVRDDEPQPGERKANVTFTVLTEQLEAELEHNSLEVDGQVYNIKVMGVGKNPREANESLQMRSQYR
jgi:hypothetical protein